jgi:hypothetical protein
MHPRLFEGWVRENDEDGFHTATLGRARLEASRDANILVRSLVG